MARKGRLRRWMKEKAGGEDGSVKMGIRASSSSVMAAAACAAASMSSSAAMALVDERMSTEVSKPNKITSWQLDGEQYNGRN